MGEVKIYLHWSIRCAVPLNIQPKMPDGVTQLLNGNIMMLKRNIHPSKTYMAITTNCVGMEDSGKYLDVNIVTLYLKFTSRYTNNIND